MTRADWLAARKRGIGGTDISAIVGVNPWRSPLDVYLDKRGLVPEQPETEAMAMGRRLEPVVLDLYTEQTGRAVVPGELIVHPRHEFALGTPDALCRDDAARLVEAKTVGSRAAAGWGEPGTDDVPEHYLVQCAWYAMLTNREVVDLAALFAGQRFAVFTIRRVQELEEALLERAAQFWRDHVLKGVPPPPQGTAADTAAIRAMFPRDARPDLLTATEDDTRTAELLAAARAQAAALEEVVALHENRLKARIGDAAGIQGHGWRVTWKASKDSSITDWRAVSLAAGATPQQIAEHTAAKAGSRRFLFATATT